LRPIIDEGAANNAIAHIYEIAEKFAQIVQQIIGCSPSGHYIDKDTATRTSVGVNMPGD
jgi:hypothetical protein